MRVIESVRVRIVLPKEKKGIDSPSVPPCLCQRSVTHWGDI